MKLVALLMQRNIYVSHVQYTSYHQKNIKVYRQWVNIVMPGDTMKSDLYGLYSGSDTGRPPFYSIFKFFKTAQNKVVKAHFYGP